MTSTSYMDNWQLPFRPQSLLGTEYGHLYNQDNSFTHIALAQVTKVNYQYNTVDFITLSDSASFAGTATGDGHSSAHLPVDFGGKLADGRAFGHFHMITIGTLILVGFIDSKKSNPIVLNVYTTNDVAQLLTRTNLTSADDSNEDLQQEVWQDFYLYPSMTYFNIDGHGNIEHTFSGHTFLYVTDAGQDGSVSDNGFEYDRLPSSRYSTGEQIEPESPYAPNILLNHGDVYGNHRLKMYISNSGLFRLSSGDIGSNYLSYFELDENGNFTLKRQTDSSLPDDPNSQNNVELDLLSEGVLRILLNGVNFFQVDPSGLSVAGVNLSNELFVQKYMSYLDTLPSSKAQIDAQYSQIVTSTYLSNTDVLALQDAYTAFSVDYGTLITTLNTAVNSPSITLVQEEAVTKAFNAYNTDTSNVSSLLSADQVLISEAIASASASDANGYTDSRISSVNTTGTPEQNAVTLINDPSVYKVHITASNGTVFQIGNTNTTLTASLIKDGNDITSSVQNNGYTWTKVNGDGSIDTVWTAAHTSVGPSVDVKDTDVANTATITLTISLIGQVMVPHGTANFINMEQVSSVAPSNPLVGSLRINPATGALEQWDGSAWATLYNDANSVLPVNNQIIETVDWTLGNISTDNTLNLSDRQFIKRQLADIIGFSISDDSATLPTASALDSAGKGSFYNIRKASQLSGISTGDPSYQDTETEWTNLTHYLASLTPVKPWDTSAKNSTEMVSVISADFISNWSAYYEAMATLDALKALSTVNTTAQSKKKTFVVQPTTPYNVGDQWQNGSVLENCTVSRYAGEAFNSSDWQVGADITSQHTSQDTSNVGGTPSSTVAQNAANGNTAYNTVSANALTWSSKPNIYRQATMPTGANVGDIWYDTSNGNRCSVWDGSAWALTIFGAYAIDVRGLIVNNGTTNTLYIDSNGNVTTTGTINATSGTIANSVVIGGTVATDVVNGAANGTTALNNLNNLQIGGVNLIVYYTAIVGDNVDGSTGALVTGYSAYIATDFIGVTANSQYVIRLNTPNSNTMIEKMVFYDSAQAWINTESVYKLDNSAYVFNAPASAAYMRVVFYNQDNTSLSLTELESINPKLESGNTPTSWTESPQDSEQQINTIESSISDMSNDNKLTPTEKQSLDKDWQAIQGEHPMIDSQATATSVSATAYDSAYNTLDSYITPLLADLTTTSDITGSTLRTNFTNYYNEKVAIQKAISDAYANVQASTAQSNAQSYASSAATTAQTNAISTSSQNTTTAINNLQVGGTNLVNNSNFANGLMDWTYNSGTNNTTADVVTDPIYGDMLHANLSGQLCKYTQTLTNVAQGTYTMSAIVKISDTSLLTGVGFVFHYTDSTYSDYTWETAPHVWNDLGNGYYKVVTTGASNTAKTISSLDVRIWSNEAVQTVEYWVGQVKFEQGDKATGFSLSLADQQAYADTAAGNAQTNAQNYADSAASTAESNAVATANQNTASAISNIEIGGVNLALGTMTPVSVTGTGGTNQAENVYTLDWNQISGKQVTLSFDMVSTTATGDCWIQLGADPWTSFIEITTLSTTNQHYTSTITLPTGTSTATSFRVRLDNVTGSVTISNLMLEFGNKETTYQPAPADTQAQIDTVNSQISDMSNDNKLTSTEKQSLEKDWQEIQGEKPTIDSSASALSVSTTDYDNAYNTLSTYITPLLADLTTTSDVVGSTLRTNFTNYYNAKIAIQSAINDAYTTTAVSNIQLGGTNLLTNSIFSGGSLTGWSTGTFDSATTYLGYGTTKLVPGNIFYQNAFSNIKPNTTYTISCYAKYTSVTGGGEFGLYFEDGVTGSYTYLPTGSADWARYTKTFTTSSAPTKCDVGFYFRSSYTAGTAWVTAFKLELGNKASDWSSALADQQSYAQTQASNAQTAAQSYADAVSSAAAESGLITTNPNFVYWQGGVPVGTAPWASGYYGAKETGITINGISAIRFSGMGTNSSGIYLSNGFFNSNIANTKYLVVSLDFYLVSGSASGAGVLIDWSGMSPYRAQFSLQSSVSSTIQTGQWYHITRTIQRPTDTLTGYSKMEGYLMANYSAFSGENLSTKDLIYGSLSVRQASQQEIDIFTGKSGWDGTSTTVSNNQSTWSLASNINSDGTFSTTKLKGTVTDTQIASSGVWNTANTLLNSWKSGTTEINGGMIATNTVYANSIAIGDFTNYVPNPYADPTLEQMSVAPSVSSSTSGVPTGCPYGHVFTLSGRDHPLNNWQQRLIPVQPGDQFYMEATVACGTGSNTFALYVYTLDQNKVNNMSFQVSRLNPTSTWTKVSGVYTVPSGVYYFSPFLQVNNGTGTTWYATAWIVRKMMTGSLIVDGAIDGQTINGVHLSGGDINIGGGTFHVDSNGYLTAANATVTNGSFFIEDDATQIKYNVQPLTNLIIDYSYENLQANTSSLGSYTSYNIYSLATDSTQKDVTGSTWHVIGAPYGRITTYQTPGQRAAIFGLDDLIVNSSNYMIYDWVVPTAGQTYTLSAYFRKCEIGTGGIPQMKVQIVSQTNTSSVVWSQTYTAPNAVAADYSTSRYAMTFTLPTSYALGYGPDASPTGYYFEYLMMSSNGNWVEVDGVQMVEGSSPTIFISEDVALRQVQNFTTQNLNANIATLTSLDVTGDTYVTGNITTAHNINANGATIPAIELRAASGGIPYIDFSNDTSDYDYRLCYNYDSSNFSIKSALSPGGTLQIGHDTNISCTGAYKSTSSSGANMFVSSSGWFYRSTSASKYKEDIEYNITDAYANQILNLQPASWHDKAQDEMMAEAIATGNYSDRMMYMQRYYGLIAEDLIKYGLSEFVTFGEPDAEGNREPEGIEYSRLWVLLLPVIREIKKQIADDEDQISLIKLIIDTFMKTNNDLQATVSELRSDFNNYVVSHP